MKASVTHNYTKLLVFSCGYAGALTEDLERVIRAHGLEDEYQTSLQNEINTGWSNNTCKRYAIPGQKSLSERLAEDTAANVQIRMNAAAKTLLYKDVDDELKLTGLTMGNLCCATVRKPSKLQWLKDSFKSNGIVTSLFGVQEGQAGYGELNKKGMFIDANGMLGENSRELATKNLGGMQSIRTNMQKYKKSQQPHTVILN